MGDMDFISKGINFVLTDKYAGWAIYSCSIALTYYSANWYFKNEDKIGRYIYWKINNIANFITGNSLKQQIKKMKKEGLEKKL